MQSTQLQRHAPAAELARPAGGDASQLDVTPLPAGLCPYVENHRKVFVMKRQKSTLRVIVATRGCLLPSAAEVRLRRFEVVGLDGVG